MYLFLEINMFKPISYFQPILAAIVVVVVVDLRAPPLIYSGHKSVDLKYWLVYNKSSVLIWLYTLGVANIYSY